MLYDLHCTAQALRAAAAWAGGSDDTSDVTLGRDGSQLTCRHRGASAAFASGAPADSGQICITPEQLAAAASWAQPGDDMADVYLLTDDRMLLITQGDDRAAFDTGGEPGSDEYLRVAPLDRA